MRNRTILAAWLFGMSGLIHAGPITYTVSSSLWAPSCFGINCGTVSGTVETDGTIGTLGASNFTTWSLLLSDGLGQSFTINPGNSSVTITGTATTATSNLLQFNFDTPNDGALGYFEIQDTTDGWGLWFALPASTALAGITNPDGGLDNGLISLDAQPVTVGTVPEPSAFLLVASALGIMGAIRYRRQRY